LSANRSPSVGNPVDVRFQSVDIRVGSLSGRSGLFNEAPGVGHVVTKLINNVLVLLHVALQLNKLLVDLIIRNN
jgi:hypothetical protein